MARAKVIAQVAIIIELSGVFAFLARGVTGLVGTVKDRGGRDETALDMERETIGAQGHADHDQKGQGQHFGQRVRCDKRGEGSGGVHSLDFIRTADGGDHAVDVKDQIKPYQRWQQDPDSRIIKRLKRGIRINRIALNRGRRV